MSNLERVKVIISALGGDTDDEIFNIAGLLDRHREGTLELVEYPFMMDLVLDKVKGIAEMFREEQSLNAEYRATADKMITLLIGKLPQYQQDQIKKGREPV